MDTLIENVLIYDGTGSMPFRADVAVSNGIIEHIGKIKVSDNFHMTVDGLQLCLAPGFIDTHSHSDLEPFRTDFLNSALRQGITTEVVGQDGFSCVPSNPNTEKKILSYMHPIRGDSAIEYGCRSLDDYMRLTENSLYPLKLKSLIGHNTLRLYVMNDTNRRASEVETDKMSELLTVCMEEGALGLSLNMQNSPGSMADDSEVTALCRVVSKHDGIVMINLQNEHSLLMESVDYVARLARISGARFHISAFKAIGMQNWGKTSRVLEKIDMYCNSGLSITFDSYPYIALCTSLKELIPHWAYSNDREKFLLNLSLSTTYPRLISEINHYIDVYGGEDNILIASSSKSSALTGRNLGEISESMGIMASEAVIQILKADANTTAIYFSISEDDMRRILVHPLQNICTDGIISLYPHPRLYGSFPRVLGRYVRELKLMKLEEAIRKMTYEPARRLKLWDRGLIREGMCADMVLFDCDAIKDNNSYFNPVSYPVGIYAVWVDGNLVYSDAGCRLAEATDLAD